MSEIRVDLDFVSTLRQQVESTTSQLRSSTPPASGTPSDPDTDDALRRFMDRWDTRRDELASSLDGVEQALDAMYTAFHGTDAELVGQLEGHCD